MKYTIPAIETEYKGRKYRSRLEAKWAVFFDLCSWQYEYEPIDFNGWFPDFALYGANGHIVYVEVKPVKQFPQNVADKVMRAYPNKNPHLELMILGVGPDSQAHVKHLCWGQSLGWIFINETLSWEEWDAGARKTVETYIKEEAQEEMYARAMSRYEPGVEFTRWTPSHVCPIGGGRNTLSALNYKRYGPPTNILTKDKLDYMDQWGEFIDKSMEMENIVHIWNRAANIVRYEHA